MTGPIPRDFVIIDLLVWVSAFSKAPNAHENKEPLMLDSPRRVSALLAECWLEYTGLGNLQHKSWLTHSRVRLLAGSSTAFQCSSQIPSCNVIRQSYPSVIWKNWSWWTCLPWIWAPACSVSNKLESWTVRLTVPALRGPGQAEVGMISLTVLQQESGDPSPLPAVPWWGGDFGLGHLTPWDTASLAKWGH